MKKLFGLIFSLSVLASASAQTNSPCDQFVAYGYPTVLDPTRHVTPLCRIAYFTLHDDVRKTPVYSAEFLLPENVSGKTDRTNDFRPDPNLEPQQRSELRDYARSGYARGHMAPAEDFRLNTAMMSQSFYLSNMVPQVGSNNSGIWRSLEMYVSNRVRGGEVLYVVTGPIYEGTVKTVGPDHVWVPTSLFKVIFDKTHRTVEAYILPNAALKGHKFTEYRVRLQDVEQRAQLRFTPNLGNGELAQQ